MEAGEAPFQKELMKALPPGLCVECRPKLRVHMGTCLATVAVRSASNWGILSPDSHALDICKIRITIRGERLTRVA